MDYFCDQTSVVCNNLCPLGASALKRHKQVEALFRGIVNTSVVMKNFRSSSQCDLGDGYVEHFNKFGELHNEDGPAIIWNKELYYYFRGTLLSFDDYSRIVGMSNTRKAMLLLQYNGYTVSKDRFI